ncbi:MAG: M28 family peptidase, partial [Clostridiales bacterium]|nr:M28 family peptidase [Clostridiales bacterium]
MRLSKIADESVNSYVADGIRHVCDTLEPRSPGSPGESDAQKYFSRELEGFADEVKTEDFTVNPRALSGSSVIIGLLMTFSAVVFILNRWAGGKADIIYPAAATLFSFAALLLYVYEQLFRRQFADFLFKKAVSRNVFATRSSSSQAKKRIILCAHADAAWESRFNASENRLFDFMSRVLAPVGAVITTLICFAYTFTDSKTISGIWLAAAVLMLLFIPSYLTLCISTSFKTVSDGANDDLSGCFTALAVMKELSENDIRFEHTQVCCLITGANEAGQRGAAAFLKKHSDEMKKIETVFVSVEALYDENELAAYSGDTMRMVKNDAGATELIVTAADNLGIPVDTRAAYCSSSDSAVFSGAGFKASAFGAAKSGPQKYYHTRFD